MLDRIIDSDGIFSQLRQEFIDSSRDQIEEIETKLNRIDTGAGTAEEELLSVQRNIHNIKGQGATFGYPLTGRVAHMLEDYLENARKIEAENITHIRSYLDLMTDLIATGESIADANPQRLLNALPTGQVVTFSTQQIHDINVLLVMPAGLQRRLVAKELLSCGFRVMRAYDGLEALSTAVDLAPDIIFVNYDIGPFNGRELANMFAAVEDLRDIHFVLLTSYESDSDKLQDLPDNISVVQKRTNFTESIGELMIQWGVFGNVPHDPPSPDEAISRHPKGVDITKTVTRRSLKILAAEDNAINQQLIKATLEGFGHQLEIVENGLQAIEAVKKEDFDLVFMDIRMPELGGTDAARAIRALPGDISGIPIIAVTADAMDEHREEYLSAGMNDCVGKPIARGELLAAINTVMGEEIHQSILSEVPITEPVSDTASTNTSDATDGDVENFLKHLQDVADKQGE